MFLLILLFFILTLLFAIFRFSNLTSRFTSRIPRFNFAHVFKNQKIKTFFQDRYYFKQQASKIATGPLLIVLGKKTDVLFDKFLKKSEDAQNYNKLWTDSGDTEAFAVMEVSYTKFLFVHPSLIEKNFEQALNTRGRFLIKRLCKLRRQNFIDGIIIISAYEAPIHSKKAQSSEISVEIINENLFHSLVFKQVCENFKIKLPLFLIEHDFSNFQENLLQNFLNINSNQESDVFFGFFCDFSKKLNDHKYIDFIKHYFIQFIDGFYRNAQKIMHQPELSNRGIEFINAIHHVELSDAFIIQNNIHCFFNFFEKKSEYAPASLTILNSILFSGSNVRECFKNIFEYFSHYGTQKIVVPQKLLNQKRRLNVILLSISAVLFFTYSYAIFRSSQFLSSQRKKIVQTISNHNSFEEASCSIIKSYSDLKKISFKSPFLFPSWKSDFSFQFQKKYKEKFSILFSDLLLKNYSHFLKQQMEIKIIEPGSSLDSIFLHFKYYADFLINHKVVYNQLTSKSALEVKKAFEQIAKILSENKCLENENTFDFLTEITDHKLEEINKIQNFIQKNSPEILKNYAKQYFTAMLNHNFFMTLALKLNEDIINFDALMNSFEKSAGNSEIDAEIVRSALATCIQDYQILADAFPSDQRQFLVSMSDFFGQDFIDLLEKIRKNDLFEEKIISDIHNAAEAAFISFKQKSETSFKRQNKFPILINNSKNGLSINPKVINLFNVLITIIELHSNLPFQSSDEDGDTIQTMSFEERKLQTLLQKRIKLQNQYNLLEFNAYPEIFSEYLQNYINDIFFDFDDEYAHQVDALLKQKTLLFETKNLFGGYNTDLKSWNGEDSPAYDLFKVNSEDTLKEILEKQKQNLVEFYNQNIDKIFKIIGPFFQEHPHLNTFYYKQWLSIQSAIHDKDNQSYHDFYNFILNTLTKFRVNDCPNGLSFLQGPSPDSDYFDSRIKYIYSKLNEQCRIIYMKTAVNNYQELVKSFNELLSGKYPFVQSESNTEYDVVTDEDLLKFLEQFQDFLKIKKDFLIKHHPEFSNRSDILDFISQMTTIMNFFNFQKIETPKNLIVFYIKNGIFHFRSRRNDEILAHRIIDWELRMGNNTYGSRYGNLESIKFTSHYGDPISFTLYFAKDSSFKPLNTLKNASNHIIKNNMISYLFKDSWSLFKLIDLHKVCKDSKNACSKEKLRFDIPLENGQTAVLYCDLTFLDSNGKPIPAPSFPMVAPYLYNASTSPH